MTTAVFPSRRMGNQTTLRTFKSFKLFKRFAPFKPLKLVFPSRPALSFCRFILKLECGTLNRVCRNAYSVFSGNCPASSATPGECGPVGSTEPAHICDVPVASDDY